jgi:hypothetical protein
MDRETEVCVGDDEPDASQIVRSLDEQTKAKSKEATTRATEGYHKTNLIRLLGEKLDIEAVELRHVQKYANGRLGEEWRGHPLGSATIRPDSPVD